MELTSYVQDFQLRCSSATAKGFLLSDYATRFFFDILYMYYSWYNIDHTMVNFQLDSCFQDLIREQQRMAALIDACHEKSGNLRDWSKTSTTTENLWPIYGHLWTAVVLLWPVHLEIIYIYIHNYINMYIYIHVCIFA